MFISFLATGGFFKLFKKFHDFSMLIQVFSNSMIFPCMELFFVIFQVFHDFQSLWESCKQTEVQVKEQCLLEGNYNHATSNLAIYFHESSQDKLPEA